MLIKCWNTCLHQNFQVPPCWSTWSFYVVLSLQPRSAWHLKISRFFVASEVVGVYSNTYQGWPSSCRQGYIRVAELQAPHKSLIENDIWTLRWVNAQHDVGRFLCFLLKRVGYGKSPKLMWHSGVVSCPVQCRIEKSTVSQGCGHPKQRTCRAAHPSFPCAASIGPGSRESMPWSRSNSSMSKYYGFWSPM